MHPLVVGFDLDQTLYDTEPAISATLAAVSAELDVDIDIPAALRELGPPLRELVGLQLPPDVADRFVAKYREIYHLHGLPAAQLMPGARDAIGAVLAAGGDCIVVSGKNNRDAKLHIAHDALPVRAVIGGSWGPGKTPVLREYGAAAYIGDHPADIAAARDAKAIALAITTGSYGPDAFPDADAVLSTLEEFPDWLHHHLTG